MTADERLGTLAAWLHERADTGSPDYLDDILGRTAGLRQRPAWRFPGRWLPMQTTLRLTPMPRVAWLLVILALVAALLGVLAVGAWRHQPAPPFGFARNGLITFGGTDGDIHTIDPISGATTALIGGSSNDRDPVLSPDGTRVFFLRDTTVPDPTLGVLEPMLMVANADGSDIRNLTEALVAFDANVWSHNAAWSSDGSRVAVASDVDGKPALRVLTVDGSAEPVTIDIRGATASFLSFRPGDREITFLGSTDAGVGLYVVTDDGRTLRTIAEWGDADYATLSPDGTSLAYAAASGGQDAHYVIHVVDIDTGVDRVPAFDPAVPDGLADNEPSWSPDGALLLFQRYGFGTYRMAVAPAAGGAVVEVGPQGSWSSGIRIGAQFSPDGSRILAHYDDVGSTWLLDPTGSTPGTLLPSSIAATASWQRLAP